MAQRLVRAKRKITTAGIPFSIPGLDQLAPRLDDVLTVIYLTYNAGYLDPSAAGQGLTEDAVWLAELVAGALPEQPEAWGLLALLTFLSARTPARFDQLRRARAAGGPGPVPLGRGGDHPGGRVPGQGGVAEPAGAVPAAGGPGRRPLQCGDLGGDRLAADRDALRHAGRARRLTDRPAEPGDRHEPRVRNRCGAGGGRGDGRPARSAITCSTPPGPSCWPGAATTTRRGRPTRRPWR